MIICNTWPGTRSHERPGFTTGGRRRSRGISSGGFRFDKRWYKSLRTSRLPSTLCRRFTLLDAMILVAAFAVGMALARIPAATYNHPWWYEGKPTYLSVKICCVVNADIGFTYPWAATASLTIVVLRLQGPRPPLRRVLQQPGMIACVVSLLGGLLGLGQLAKEISLASLPGGLAFAHRWFWRAYVEKSCVAVVGAWMTLALSGRWRPERCWIDRAGRVAGAYWITVAVLLAVFTWLEALFNALGCW
jgi:hypothetical protein